MKKSKQKFLTSDNIFVGLAMFMYVHNRERTLQITGQMKNRGAKSDSKLVITVGEKATLCEYSKAEGQLNINCEDGLVSVKGSWNPGDEVFNGEINGEEVTGLKIIKEGRIGNYIIQYIGSDVFVTVRSPKASEFDKFMPVPEEVKPKVQEKPAKAVGSSEEDVAVAIAAIKLKHSKQ
jgi:hypothetical protein